MTALASLRWLVGGLLVVVAAAPAAVADEPVLDLPFDGDLLDRSGHGNDAWRSRPEFAPGQLGQGLVPGGQAATVADAAELRLQPGFQVDCFLYFQRVTSGIIPIVSKGNEFTLRVNPKSEDGAFAFFVCLDGSWERRVTSEIVPEEGRWYRLEAGWDGEAIWLRVDGQEFRRERTGTVRTMHRPVEIGPVEATVDEVRILNPQARTFGNAYWTFDGHLRDETGHGHDFAGTSAGFGPGRSGSEAVRADRALEAPSSPDLQLAAGLRITCTVRFEEVSPGYTYLVVKDDEYMLRVDNAAEGGWFTFFVKGEGWEPRVKSPVRPEPGVWYKLVAGWDGVNLTLSVNGQEAMLPRVVRPVPTAAPLVVGPFAGTMDELRIENPRLPVLRCLALTQAETLHRAGQPSMLQAEIQNVGVPVTGAAATLALTEGVTVDGEATRPLGDLAAGETRTVEWTVRSDRPVTAVAAVELRSDREVHATLRRTVSFFNATATPMPPVPQMTGEPATTWYIDSVAGDNARDGQTPETAWRDFERINGQVLGPGDRLLLKRGSVFTGELRLGATATAGRWAEIGSYGEGARPILRGAWDIADRCVWIRDPDYLRVHGLTVSYAGKGLVVQYTAGGTAGW